MTYTRTRMYFYKATFIALIQIFSSLAFSKPNNCVVSSNTHENRIETSMDYYEGIFEKTYKYYLKLDITCEISDDMNIIEQHISPDDMKKYKNGDGFLPDIKLIIQHSTRISFLKPTLLYKIASRIVEININNCSIEEIDKNLFGTDSTKLEDIDLNNNKIKHLDTYLFQNLNNLKTLEINQNDLTTFKASMTTNIIDSIDLSINDLSSLDINATNLQSLNLSHNNIHDLTLFHFQGISNLKRLHLNNNNITSLSGRVFLNLIYLDFLDLSWNRLIQINLSSFLGLQMLTNLSVSNNQLRTLNVNAFHDLDSLKNLELSGNLLRVLNTDLFSKSTLSMLKYVSLYNNSWNCDNLAAIIRICNERNVLVMRGVDKSESSIRGIQCTMATPLNNENWANLDNESISNIGNNIIDKLDILINNSNVTLNTSKLSDFYDFFNRGFHRSAFAKFFYGDFKNFAFFKYLEKQMLNYSVQAVLNQSQSNNQNISIITDILANLNTNSINNFAAEKYVSGESNATNNSIFSIVIILCIQTLFIMLLCLMAFVFAYNKFSGKCKQKIITCKKGKSIDSNITIDELECM